MQNGEAKTEFGIVVLKCKLLLPFPFFILHLFLCFFVSLWQN